MISRFILAGALSLFLASQCPIEAAFCGYLPPEYTDCDGDVWVGLGYREDNLNWTIAGPGGVPDILSELKWQKLHILEASAIGWHSSPEGYYFRWGASYGSIMHGTVVDRDFAGNHRTLEFAHSVADASRGNTLDGLVGVGYQLSTSEKGILLALVGGWSYHEQSLHMFHGRLTLNAFNPTDIGRIRGLNSTYKAKWSGPWIGLDLEWQANCEFVYTGTIEYHAAKYRGRGHWNLRPDIVGDFVQDAYGHGTIGRFGIQYLFMCDWLFNLNGTIQRWNTGGGKDKTPVRVFITDGFDNIIGADTVTVVSPFNGAHWDSYSVTLAIEYRY